jgi:hypothetical protein
MAATNPIAPKPFQVDEIVRVVVQPPRTKETVAGMEGFISWVSAPDEHGRRIYGVHLNEYGQPFAIDAEGLQATGLFRDVEHHRIVTRNRTAWFAGSCNLLKTDDNLRALLAYRETALRANAKDPPPGAAKFARRIEMIERQLREWGINF